MKKIKIILLVALSLLLITSIAHAVQIGPDPTDAIVNANGPFAISSLAVASSSVSGFGGGTIYYPSTAGSYGVIVMCPGFTNTQTSLAKVAQRIATHGFVVFNISTTSAIDFPPVRVTNMQAAVKYMKNLTNSTITARMDLSRIGVSGYSMGGGATVILLSTDSSYKVGFAMAPYRQDGGTGSFCSTITTPTVMLGGDNDTVAPVSSNAQGFYDNIPLTIPKVLGVLTSADHFAYISSTINERVGRYAVVAFKRFLDGDMRYASFLDGSAASAYNTSARFASYTYHIPPSPLYTTLWRNTSDGRVTIWFINADGTINSSVTDGSADSNWTIAGTGDFNKDGTSDILWRNTDGRTTIWFMNADGTHARSQYAGSADSNWTIAGIGDFNSDGIPDIFWRNTYDQRTSIWFMNSDGTQNSSVSTGSCGPHWMVAAIGDFNGDGVSDILWRNTSDGRTNIWFMNNGGTRNSSVDIGTVSLAWTIAGAADFNKDGISDILWRNTDGRTLIWFMNSNATQARSQYVGSADSNWTIAGTGDVNADGIPDILWRNTSDGRMVVWFLNTDGTKASSQYTGYAGLDWTIAGRTR